MRNNYSEFIMIILTSLILSCNAFWWRTTTEAAPLIRQMPISYFRTYTYHQPIGYPGTLFQSPSYNQYALPSRFAGWSQFPAASDGVSVLSNYRPDTTTVTILPPTQTTTTTPAPTQRPTLPPPPAPSTHSPNLQSSVPSPPQSPTISLPLQPMTGQPAQYSLSSSYTSSSGHHYVETHPPSAKYLSSGPIRTSYLTPDYPNQYYHTSPNGNSNSNPTLASAQNRNINAVPTGQYQRQQIRFVPCMCPVSVAISNEFPESRSTSNEDDDMILPENDDSVIKSKDVEEINISS